MNITDRLIASSVTFRDEPLAGALHRLRAIGFTRLDLTAIRHYCDHFDPLLVDVGEEACLRTRELIDRFGMQTVSITSYPANPLAKDLNGSDWTDGVDAYVRLAQKLNAFYLIFPPGTPTPPPDRWRGVAEHAIPWLREAARRANSAKIAPSLALQSNSLLRTSEQGVEMLGLLKIHPLGIAVDPAHLAAMGEDPAEAIRGMGQAINIVALRDTDGENFNLPPGGGNLDYPAILQALADIDYTGPLMLAIDDISIPPDHRARMLTDAWEYLESVTLPKAA